MIDFLQRVAKSELGESVWLDFEAADDLAVWRWPRMPAYNGFIHEERVRGWQFVHWMIKTGRMAKAGRCSISGSKHKLQYHSEDYYRPWTAYPISKPLHLALHRRFRQPDKWREICEAYTSTHDEWYRRLLPTPHDLAGELRTSILGPTSLIQL